MKYIALISIIIGFCTFVQAEWQSIGPYGTNISAMAAAPSSENIIYASSYSSPTKIFKSTNNGALWTQVGSIQYYVYSLAVDPTNPDVVYAGGDVLIYKSIDGGATWVSYSVSGLLFNGLEVHPTSPSRIFAAGMTSGSNFGMGFFISVDGGESWTTVPLNNFSGQAYCLAVDPSNPNIIYVGGYYYNAGNNPSIYKSTDGGTNFTEMSSGFASSCSAVYSLAIHLTNSNIICAGTRNGGIYRSTNSGGDWVLTSPPTYINIHTLATTMADGDVIFAGADTTVYKSTNSGVSWFNSGSGLGGWNFHGLVANHTQSTIAYAANSSGIYKTTNSGTDWFSSSYGINLAPISTFTVSPSSPSTIYAEFDGVGVYKTIDSGVSWSPLPKFSSCGNMCELAINYSDPNIVLALEGSG